MDRIIQLERGRIDLKTGEFPLTLMTNGEASDGHIVDLKTLIIPGVMPMFINHEADPVSRLGQMNNPHVTGKVTQLGKARLRMVGRIDMEGDSPQSEIRRDIAQGIHVGDITNLSGRWTGGTETARSALAKNHFAFSEIPGGWQTPTFFEGSTMQEGSVVGLGADTAALIGRSHDLGKPSHVRDFYQMLVRSSLPELDESEEDDIREIEEEEIALAGKMERERIEVTTEPETIERASSDALDTQSDSTEQRADPLEAMGFELSDISLQDLGEFMRDLDEQSAAKRKAQRDQLLFDTLGVIPDGT